MEDFENRTPEELEYEEKEMKRILRTMLGLPSLKSKRVPKYIKKSLRQKEWQTGDELGETNMAK